MDEPKPLHPHRITIPLTDEDMRWLRSRAKAERRPLAQMGRLVLMEGIEARRERERKGKEEGQECPLKS
jgi:hypothetical protein